MSYPKSAGYADTNRDYESPAGAPPAYNNPVYNNNPFLDEHRSPDPYPPRQQPSPYTNQPPQFPTYSSQSPASSPPEPLSAYTSITKRTPPPLPSRPSAFPPFETFTVYALGYRLADGFPTDLPLAYEQLHPLSSHDVIRDDWARFLLDVNGIARTSSEERLRENFHAEPSRNANPMLMPARGGLVRGLLGAAIEGASSRMGGGSGAKAAQEPISRLLADWNRNYWNRRQIEVSLVLKDVSDSGLSAMPGRGGLLGGLGGGGRRQARKEKRQERNAFKQDIIADVHSMFSSSQASTYRASADQARYGSKPGWCLVFRYTGPAGVGFAGGNESGGATRP
ncbi:hypothetical protein BD309DRAFT_873244 [Dichomitus squalens]|nr:hypothetical protein BD309DRAFT_873244 [Dichomitus squalens]